MRLIASLMTFGCLALAAWLGQQLWQLHSTLQPAPPALSAQLAPGPATTGAAPARARIWPALFGTPVTVEPQPPAPPLPPIASLGYRLKGVVRNGSADWAIVTHPTGDLLLKAGDMLTEGVEVLEISAEGLWLGNAEQRQLLEFEPHSP